MDEGRAVTCSACKLKYFARQGGTCPRCQAPAEADPLDRRPWAAPPPVLPPPPTGGQTSPALKIIVVGILIAAGVGWCTSPFSPWKKPGTVINPNAGECARLVALVKEDDAIVASLDQISKTRSTDMNFHLTVPDMARQVEKAAAELEGLALTNPELKTIAGDYAVILRRMADIARDVLVTARAGDVPRMEKLKDKMAQEAAAEKEISARIGKACGW